MEGVELEPEPPAVAFALLPVEAEAAEPPDPEEFADVEVFVVVEGWPNRPTSRWESGWASGKRWESGWASGTR